MHANTAFIWVLVKCLNYSREKCDNSVEAELYSLCFNMYLISVVIKKFPFLLKYLLRTLILLLHGMEYITVFRNTLQKPGPSYYIGYLRTFLSTFPLRACD